VRRLLVLTATDLEARSLARHLGLVPTSGGGWPRFAGGVIEIVPVGVAAAHLTSRLAGAAPGTLVVSAGTCGALAPALGVGALVVPETVVGADGQRRATATGGGARRYGTLLTTDRVVEDAATKSRLWLATGALAVDMESAIILGWAEANRLPGLVVRGVSDAAARGVPADLARVVRDDGRVRPMRAVATMLARPGAVADAVALRAGTTAALKTVAATLGTLARAS
jgi:nucleoside phosphorylase